RSGTRHALLYRLVGLSNDWHTDNSRRRATYTNLLPGDYTFEVKAESGSGVKVKQLKITITPPFWQTWWAYLFYMMLLGICITLAINFAKTLLRLRQDIIIQKKITDLKVDFFTNISHELRTPLTLILNRIEEIERYEPLSLQGTQYIGIVKKNASRMVRFMNQWLDFRQVQNGKYNLKIEQVDVVALVKRVADYFVNT